MISFGRAIFFSDLDFGVLKCCLCFPCAELSFSQLLQPSVLGFVHRLCCEFHPSLLQGLCLCLTFSKFDDFSLLWHKKYSPHSLRLTKLVYDMTNKPQSLILRLSSLGVQQSSGWGRVWRFRSVWRIWPIWRLWCSGWWIRIRWWRWRWWRTRSHVLLLGREHRLHGAGPGFPQYCPHHHLFPLYHWLQLPQGMGCWMHSAPQKSTNSFSCVCALSCTFMHCFLSPVFYTL